MSKTQKKNKGKNSYITENLKDEIKNVAEGSDNKVESENPFTELRRPESATNVLSQLVGTLEDALEEDIDEFDEFLENGTDSALSDGENIKTKHRKGVIGIGIVTFIFTIIGIAASSVFVSGVVKDLIEQKSLKEELTIFVFPVVITDPPEFENAQSLQPTTVIASSIWRIILFGDTANYEKDMGIMTIPAIDVEASARSIFGYGYDISHRSIENIEYLFEYSPETNSYTVPERPPSTSYIPKIIGLENLEETYSVIVDYVTPNPLSSVGITSEDNSIKTLVYTISRTKERMTITSIKFVPREEISSP